MWDIGGQREIRPYWRNYYEQTDALIYVVDSADENRVMEVKENLTELLGEELLSGVPLLVFANKQDLDLALDAPEIMNTLELNAITDRTWNIQACSAVSQEGLNEGMEWLINTINAKTQAAAGGGAGGAQWIDMYETRSDRCTAFTTYRLAS